MLPDIVNRNYYPKVGITATQGTITLRIASEAETEEECHRIMEPTAKLIYEKLGDLIFGEGDDRLQDVVCRKLNANKKTLAVVEAGTHGHLAEALSLSPYSNQEGIPTCFAGGIVLPPKQPVTVEEMVRRGRRLFNVDYLLLIGAYPPGEPDRERNEKVFVALIDNTKPDPAPILLFEEYPFVGHPDLIDDLYVKRALNLLRKI